MNGIYAALLTPVDEQGNLDEQALVKLVNYELDQGVEGFYCCGSSGEGLLLERNERKRLVEVVASEVSGEVPFIVHTGALSTASVVDLSIHAQACGAQAVSLIPPIYYSYTPMEVEHHYRSVVEALHIGVIVYNIPQFTGITFSKKMNSSLLNDSRIIGIKHTSMNLYELERIHEAFPDKILYNGFDEMYLYSMTAGAHATIGTTVNICPRIFKEIRDRFTHGDLTQAREVQSTLNAFIEALVENGIFSAAKYAMEVLGVPCGPCRRPFLPLSNQQQGNVREALKIVESWL
ncbi:MAG TPA: N-acetylneuraminate lyase [Sphaerochaeta sp.]|nr:MAG: N-acetylneuraminate lyase [Spirochaetae bacterium HGW-Spirochaetae-4]HCJ94770.1 N-acetylneuraminate lyase [Sphaerochaeta sp.]